MDAESPQYPSCWRRELAGWVVFALVLRVALTVAGWERIPGMVESDALGYHKGASNLLHAGVFSESDTPPLVPISFRTPGYPFFLAVLYGLGLEGHPQGVVLVQAALGALAVGLIWLIGLWLGGLAVARVAAALAALDPASIGLAQYLLTETLFVFFLCLAIFFLITLARARPAAGLLRLWIAAAAGLTVGLLPLIRPVAIFLPLVAGAWAALVFLRRSQGRRTSAWAMIASIFLLSIAPPALWAMRNQRVFGDFYFCEIGAVNLYAYRAMKVRSLATGESFDSLFAEAFKTWWPRIYEPKQSPARAKREMTHNALDVFRRHPGALAHMTAAGLKSLVGSPSADLWSKPLGIDSVFSRPPTWPFILTQLERAILWLTALGVVAGLALALIGRRRDPAILLIGAILLCFWMVSCGPESGARLRAGFWPVEILAAAWGWRILFMCIRERKIVGYGP